MSRAAWTLVAWLARGLGDPLAVRLARAAARPLARAGWLRWTADDVGGP